VWHHFLNTQSSLIAQKIREVYEEGLWLDFWESQGISTKDITKLREFGERWKEAVLERVKTNSGERDVAKLREKVRSKAEEILKEL
jgi:hypothetical protein